MFPVHQTQELVFCEREAAKVNPQPLKDNQNVPLGNVWADLWIRTRRPTKRNIPHYPTVSTVQTESKAPTGSDLYLHSASAVMDVSISAGAVWRTGLFFLINVKMFYGVVSIVGT